MQRPWVGAIVHYRSYGTPGGEFLPECRAAMVTELTQDEGLPSDNVGLVVLNPTGQFFHPLALDGGCRHDESASYGGTWHWPEPADPVGDVLDELG